MGGLRDKRDVLMKVSEGEQRNERGPPGLDLDMSDEVREEREREKKEVEGKKERKKDRIFTMLQPS